MSSARAKKITSTSNATYKMLLELQSTKSIKKHGLILVSGTKIINEVICNFPEKAVAWITSVNGAEPPRELPLYWYEFPASLFNEIDSIGTGSPLLLMKLPDIIEWRDEDEWPQGCTLFVGFQNPENVGAVIRSAGAFGVSRIVFLKEAAHPFLPKSIRAAGPALFQLPLFFGPSIEDLCSNKVPLIGLDMNAPDIESAPFSPVFGLVPGIEGPGLPEKNFKKENCRSIRMKNSFDSINAATATAIALYVWQKNSGGYLGDSVTF